MIKRKTVLIVDDEPQIRDGLRVFFDSADYRVAEANCGVQAVRMTVSLRPHLILLDSTLPDGDDGDIIAAVREWTEAALIVLVESDANNKIAGVFDAGADDYVLKPFDADILAARIRAHTRKKAHGDNWKWEIRNGWMRLDPIRHKVYVGKRTIELMPDEYRLLRYLVVHHGRIVTYRQILKGIECLGLSIEHLRMRVHQLRRKIDHDANMPELTEVPGVGYRMEVVENSLVAA
ncbi:MAG: response regulator transcription factor [Alphaproteobacteria bacterium]